MANFFFDGTASVTAAKSDVVVITANPALFTSQAQVGGNVVLTYSNGTTLTVTGTTLGDNTTNLPGVSLANGTFATGANVDAVTAGQNGLFFNGTSAIATAPLTGNGAFTANSVHAIFGGNGRSDAADTADNIQIGGKGSFLVYGNAGADAITQGVNNAANIADGSIATGGNAFDSTSFVTVFGGKNDLGNDSILLANTANSGAKLAIYGGEGTDSINIFNTGTGANTAIFGGQGAADSTDLADSIAFNGGGTVSIFGNAGNDIITVGAGSTLANGSSVTIHGGIGSDNIAVTGSGGATNSTIVVYGDENLAGANADSVSVTNASGTTVIYGGTAAADANDNADLISYSGQGTATIYAAAGNDSVTINTAGATANSASTTTVFLGNGDDSINILNTSVATGTQSITGGAGADNFVVGTSTVAATTASAVGTGNTISITDFQVGIDVLSVNNSTAGSATTKAAFVAAAGGSLQDALDAASQNTTIGQVGVVTFGSDTYVVVTGSAGGGATAAGGVGPALGFQVGSDIAIKLTGVTDTAGVLAAVAIV